MACLGELDGSWLNMVENQGFRKAGCTCAFIHLDVCRHCLKVIISIPNTSLSPGYPLSTSPSPPLPEPDMQLLLEIPPSLKCSWFHLLNVYICLGSSSSFTLVTTVLVCCFIFLHQDDSNSLLADNFPQSHALYQSGRSNSNLDNSRRVYKDVGKGS